ncbi:MAG: TIGR03790 family protein [bacterium]
MALAEKAIYCAAAFALAALLLVSCTGPAGRSELEMESGSWNLPAPGALDELPQQQRSVSDGRLELLSSTPLMLSGSGATAVPGQLSLLPVDSKPAWAIYAVSGLEEGSGKKPLSLTTGADAAFLLGIADYASGRWTWQAIAEDTRLEFGSGQQLISPAGRLYIAALAWQQPVLLDRLELQLSTELPGAPLVQVNLPFQPIGGYACEYNALGSTPGDGTQITAVHYDFGDGSEEVLATDPASAVSHAYPGPGSYELTVWVFNELGQGGSTSVEVDNAAGYAELLVVCNGDDPESMELADYYMSPFTGRGIAVANRLELALGGDPGPDIPRAEFEAVIRDPLRAFITDKGLTDSLKYILLMDGIPHRIPGANGGQITLSTDTAVDSELCLLFSDGSYPHEGYIWNAELFHDVQETERAARSFHAGLAGLESDYDFRHGDFDVTDRDNTVYPLDYLVGRLDAYNLADAKALVDRSLAADTTGAGWIILDTTEYDSGWDTMYDPVWPRDDELEDSGAELFAAAGYKHFLDVTETRITGQPSDGMPAGSVDNVIAYAGWGMNHTGGSWPHAREYILDDLQFSYLPGAAWLSYESFNGLDLDSADPDNDRSDITRWQGMICDFLHRGGSCAVGHVYEPWTIGMADERVVFYRYCVRGDNWIESAYKGLRTLSWQDIVVGDPLCRVK